MKNILKIQASLHGADGQSSRLADAYVAELLKRNPGSRVVTRDLVASPVPQLTLARFQAFRTDPDARTDAQRADVAESDALIAELHAADVIVFAVPMYNFNVPTALHNYFDHIARAGVTFRYTEAGPEGLLTGKSAIVALTRGGLYSEGPAQAMDSQEPHLRTLLRFIGITDVSFVRAERLALGEELRAAAIGAAEGELSRVLQQAAA